MKIGDKVRVMPSDRALHQMFPDMINSFIVNNYIFIITNINGHDFTIKSINGNQTWYVDDVYFIITPADDLYELPLELFKI